MVKKIELFAGTSIIDYKAEYDSMLMMFADDLFKEYANLGTMQTLSNVALVVSNRDLVPVRDYDNVMDAIKQLYNITTKVLQQLYDPVAQSNEAVLNWASNHKQRKEPFSSAGALEEVRDDDGAGKCPYHERHGGCSYEYNLEHACTGRDVWKRQ